MNKKDPEYNATMLRKQNMDLWNSLAESDMKYLKKVSFGSRKFTSIDPQYQIRKMTEKFGPVGPVSYTHLRAHETAS